MIDISISHDSIWVRGHAGYAPEGSDIVCAGVTALVQGFIRSVEELTQDAIKYDISHGSADIDTRNLGSDAQLLIDSFFIGVKQIADEFPDYVRVSRSNTPG